ncbi:hypothetical protein O6P43_034204, partial [Quillaja saponaria]
SWCSWLSRQSNTLKVSGSSPGDAIFKHLPTMCRGDCLTRASVTEAAWKVFDRMPGFVTMKLMFDGYAKEQLDIGSCWKTFQNMQGLRVKQDSFIIVNKMHFQFVLKLRTLEQAE